MLETILKLLLIVASVGLSPFVVFFFAKLFAFGYHCGKRKAEQTYGSSIDENEASTRKRF